jgi:predicted HD phosphohydrolase
LCAVDELDAQQLSPASAQSLALQGGPMSDAEAAAFIESPYATDAVALRVWDDEAKCPGLEVPPLETYISCLERLLKRTANACPSV